MTQDEITLPDSAADDVEGHGLKELAAGLSTAAVLASGAAGTTALTAEHSVAGSASAGPASVSLQADPERGVSVSAPVQLERAGGTQQVRDTAKAATSQVAATARAAVRQASTTAVDTTAQAQSVAAAAAADPIGTTDRVVDAAIAQARATRDRARDTAAATVVQAQATVAQTQATVAQVSQDVVRQAENQVATTQATANRVLAEATTTAAAGVERAATTMTAALELAKGTVGAAQSLVVAVMPSRAGASMERQGMGGTVTVYMDGVAVGTTNVADGRAVVQLAGPMIGSHAISVTYSGDGAHLPSTTSL